MQNKEAEVKKLMEVLRLEPAHNILPGNVGLDSPGLGSPIQQPPQPAAGQQSGASDVPAAGTTATSDNRTTLNHINVTAKVSDLKLKTQLLRLVHL